MKVSIQIQGSPYIVEMNDCCLLRLSCPRCGYEVNVKPETVEANVAEFDGHAKSCEAQA